MATTELVEYKKIKINEITVNYNKNVNNTTQYYLNIINILSRSRNLNRNIQINNVKNILNTKIEILKNQYNNDLLAINNLTMNKFSPSVIGKNALLVGIIYKGTENQLNGCINDVLSMNERIKSQGFQNIKLLTDDTQQKPTRNNILNEFKNLLINSKTGDLLIFVYSGHGYYSQDRNNDEKTGYDQLIIPIDQNPIVDDELKSIIQTYLKKDVTLFAMFDSCFSGSVLDLKYQYLDSLDYDKFTENDKELETLGDVLCISGCTDRQTSADANINNTYHGALTWALLETLNNKKVETWRELIKNMRDLLKTNGYSQIPQFSSGKFINIDSNVFI